MLGGRNRRHIARGRMNQRESSSEYKLLHSEYTHIFTTTAAGHQLIHVPTCTCI